MNTTEFKRLPRERIEEYRRAMGWPELVEHIDAIEAELQSESDRAIATLEAVEHDLYVERERANAAAARACALVETCARGEQDMSAAFSEYQNAIENAHHACHNHEYWTDEQRGPIKEALAKFNGAAEKLRAELKKADREELVVVGDDWSAKKATEEETP
jgi:hypothetical protein